MPPVLDSDVRHASIVAESGSRVSLAEKDCIFFGGGKGEGERSERWRQSKGNETESKALNVFARLGSIRKQQTVAQSIQRLSMAHQSTFPTGRLATIDSDKIQSRVASA